MGMKLNRRIYRYMPYFRYLEMITNGTIVMPRWTEWEDPFEGFLLKRYLNRWPQCQHAKLLSSLYCLCFTTDMEKDLIWRSYTPCRDGVRIETTVGELMEELGDGYYLGEVRYTNRKSMKDVHDKALGNESLSVDDLRELFLYKLLGFEYDKEVRVLTVDSSIDEKIRVVPINACKLFSKVMLDPRMKESAFHGCKNDIERVLTSKGIEPCVSKSTLYDPVKHLNLVG